MLDGKLLDGRNRWEACKLAGVEPRFTEFNGDDPIGWVKIFPNDSRVITRHGQN